MNDDEEEPPTDNLWHSAFVVCAVLIAFGIHWLTLVPKK